MPKTIVSAEPLDSSISLAQVDNPAHGAVVTFTGVVRNISRGDTVYSIIYETYQQLAQSEIEKIVAETENQWKVTCAVQHRVGEVAAGETSVFIAISSAHRDEAFRSCAWVLEELKARVPIWKRELYAGGERWIEGSQAFERTNSAQID